MISALLNHLWQSTLFALLAGLLTLALRKNRARIRYWLWFAASVKFLVPFLVLEAVGARLFPTLHASAPVAAEIAKKMAEPFSAAAFGPAWSGPALSVSSDSGVELLLLALWSVGLATVVAAWVGRSARVRAALRAAEPLVLKPLARVSPVPVLSSPILIEPGVVGIWRSTLIFPDGIAARLTPAELDTILAHELCHLRRRDNLLATIHMLVEALFWFHPLVWWLGARLIEEREVACDEAVVDAGADPRVYAEAILKVCRLYMQSPLACAAGVTGADLKTRIERIMAARAGRLTPGKTVLLAGAACACLVMPISIGAWQVEAETAQVAPTPGDIVRLRAEQRARRRQVRIDPRSFDRFVGYYQFSGGLPLEKISRTGDRFFAQVTGASPVEVYPESSTKFFQTDAPAQISFLADSRGEVRELVLHRGGYEQHLPRIDAAAGKRLEADLSQRIRANRPSPGTEASLRRYVIAMERGRPNYDEMIPALAVAVRMQFPTTGRRVKQYGALKSIVFHHVDPQGFDVYKVSFQSRNVEWSVGPLTSDGKVSARFYRDWKD